MENNTIINCTNVIDDSVCTVIIKYKVYRNDSGKLFGKLLALKHKVENFLKEVLDEEILFKNPVLQRTKDGLVDLFQGLTSLCSGISQSREMLMIPELPLDCDKTKSSYEMKFIKGVSPAEMWLCYVDNGEFLNLLKRLSEKHENDELEPFIFYPRVGEHVYFKQGANIFRGIVQEYVIPDECEDEEHVDVKVLNIDNSDVVVLPQNCFFQMDKEGIELPMQCVCCSLVNIEKNSVDGPQQSDLSLAMLKKHKLNVTFNCEKVNVKGLPLGAQCVTITLSADKIKDKKNSFNVNSKEFVPRSSVPNAAQPTEGILDNDSKSDQTTRSSSPGSSQDDIEKPAEDTSTIRTGPCASPTKKTESKAPLVAHEPSTNAAGPKAADSIKEKSENKANVINYCGKNSISPTVTQPTVSNTFKPHDKDRVQMYGTKEYRYNSSKLNDVKGNKSMAAVTDKMKNARISSPNHENRTKSGPPSTGSHPSQTQSPANLPPNPPVPPYLFQSVQQFPPGPIHFPGQYVPIPAPQQLNSSVPFHFPQYPYAAAAQTYVQSAPPPPAGHTPTYHMPPANSPYQQYMQPVAVGPFFSSQPPFSQQFYQPLHLQQTWSHLQPSFQMGGSPQQAAAAAAAASAGKTDVSNSPAMSKFK